jgi:two-component system chemotaxis response regulator CheB
MVVRTPDNQIQRRVVPKIAVIVVAASAGGHAIVRRFLSSLPAPFDIPIVLVQHLSPQFPSMLAQLLGRWTALPVKEVEDGEALLSGMVYVAPPDHHVVIDDAHRLRLTSAPREHWVRPSADPLFDSAALAFGEGVLGVILTGNGSDGATGAVSIRKAGGLVMVQDPDTADYSSMPRAALRIGAVDFVVPPDGLASAVTSLARGEMP